MADDLPALEEFHASRHESRFFLASSRDAPPQRIDPTPSRHDANPSTRVHQSRLPPASVRWCTRPPRNPTTWRLTSPRHWTRAAGIGRSQGLKAKGQVSAPGRSSTSARRLSHAQCGWAAPHTGQRWSSARSLGKNRGQTHSGTHPPATGLASIGLHPRETLARTARAGSRRFRVPHPGPRQTGVDSATPATGTSVASGSARSPSSTNTERSQRPAGREK